MSDRVIEENHERAIRKLVYEYPVDVVLRSMARWLRVRSGEAERRGHNYLASALAVQAKVLEECSNDIRE